MAVAHRFRLSRHFNMDGAAKTLAFMFSRHSYLPSWFCVGFQFDDFAAAAAG